MYIYTYIDCKYVVLFTCKYILHACKQYYSSKPLVYQWLLAPFHTLFTKIRVLPVPPPTHPADEKSKLSPTYGSYMTYLHYSNKYAYIYIYHISINNIYVHTYIHIYMYIYISITNTHIYIYISIILYSWYVIVVISCVYLMIIKWSTIFQ